MAADSRTEDYPHEIDDQLTAFDSSVSSVKSMLDKLMSMPRNELLQKVGCCESLVACEDLKKADTHHVHPVIG